jgi:hypothetical protein
MPFNQYKSIGEVVKEFGIAYTEADFIAELPIELHEYFKADLSMVLAEGIVNNSEAAICESLIYPVLKEVWKLYKQDFVLWSHQPLYYSEKLSGIPDFMFARRSPLGKVVFEQPFLVVVEAKKDNFEAGWGQCLAELIAVARINQAEFGASDRPGNNQTIEHKEPLGKVFGIVSNGEFWEFGKLENQQFTKHIGSYAYTIRNLERLTAALSYLLAQSQQQLTAAIVS